MILMRTGNQKATINNKFRAIEQNIVLDPVKLNILGNTFKTEHCVKRANIF